MLSQKGICFTLGLLVGLLTMISPRPAAADPEATHGMLFFGQQHLYLSHLPMFHSPHNYQAIFEIEVPAEVKAAYTKDAAAAKPDLFYTLVPGPFILPEMAAHPRAFQGTLFHGHFERGGMPLVENFTVKITRVILFNKLSASTPIPNYGRYFLFGAKGQAGKSDELFVAHRITGEPNFDQISKVKVNEPTFTAAVTNTVLDFTIETPDPKVLTDGQSIEATATPGKAKLEIEHVIYTEFGDLAPSDLF